MGRTKLRKQDHRDNKRIAVFESIITNTEKTAVGTLCGKCEAMFDFLHFLTQFTIPPITLQHTTFIWMLVCMQIGNSHIEYSLDAR